MSRSRIYLIIALCFLLGTVLAACGGANEDNGNVAEEGTEEENGDVEEGNEEAEDGNEETVEPDAEPTGDAEHLLRVSHNMAPDSGPGESAEKFKELVEERTNGAIEVQVYPANQLGSMREQTESVQFGSVEMTIQPISTLTPFTEDVQIVDFPFIWPEEDEVMWEVLDGEAGDQILETMEESGFKGLGFWASGYKAMTGNSPIESPDDLNGFDMRVIPSDLLIAQFEAWGANPVPIDFAELYNSLQQGVVDGQENPLETIYLEAYYEVQDHLTIANHGYLAYISTFNKDFFDSLSPEYQDIIVEAEIEARELGRDIAAEMEEEYIENLEETGIEIHTLTDEQRAEFEELSLPVHEEFSQTERQQDILQTVYDAVEAAQN